jgi:hypothetical protein
MSARQNSSLARRPRRALQQLTREACPNVFVGVDRVRPGADRRSRCHGRDCPDHLLDCRARLAVNDLDTTPEPDETRRGANIAQLPGCGRAKSYNAGKAPTERNRSETGRELMRLALVRPERVDANSLILSSGLAVRNGRQHPILLPHRLSLLCAAKRIERVTGVKLAPRAMSCPAL